MLTFQSSLSLRCPQHSSHSGSWSYSHLDLYLWQRALTLVPLPSHWIWPKCRHRSESTFLHQLHHFVWSWSSDHDWGSHCGTRWRAACTGCFFMFPSLSSVMTVTASRCSCLRLLAARACGYLWSTWSYRSRVSHRTRTQSLFSSSRHASSHQTYWCWFGGLVAIFALAWTSLHPVFRVFRGDMRCLQSVPRR